MPSQLGKGQNAPLSANDIVVSVQLAAPADISALLVTEHGKVRTDADFVFYNQPTGPGVRLVNGPPGQPKSLAISLSAVPADIAQVRAVITLDNPSQSFGQFPPPVAKVSDANGNALYDYVVDGLSAESIVIALEVYRRQGAWKVRAVGQGYAGGFAALVTDHGVSVDDNQASSTPPPAPTQPAAFPATPSYSAPPAPSYPPPSSSYPPPAPNYPSAPTYPPPAPNSPPAFPTTPSYSAPPSSPPPSAPPPSAPPEVSLSKSRPVSLQKGQKVTLKKEGGVALTFIHMGLGWDPLKKQGLFGGGRPADIDLDATAMLLAGNQLADVAYFGQLRSKDGSIQHQGDNLTGEGEGDDEVILVDLTRVPPHITAIIFIVTSYRGHTFAQVQNAFCRLVDKQSNAELARYTLSGGAPTTGMVMAKVYRSGSEWKLQAIGEPIQAKNPKEAAPQMARFV